MQRHQLQPNNKLKDKKIVGRGGKKGTYSGRGGKGQTARSGRKVVPIIRELIKRYPKLKGYRSFVFENGTLVVNLDALQKHFKDGDIVTPEVLVSKGIVRAVNGKITEIKILGRGSIDKKLTIERCKVSASVKQAVEKAGGTIK